jgi:hypothetical protein
MIIATRNVLVVPVSPKQSLFLLAAKEGGSCLCLRLHLHYKNSIRVEEARAKYPMVLLMDTFYA